MTGIKELDRSQVELLFFFLNNGPSAIFRST